MLLDMSIHKSRRRLTVKVKVDRRIRNYGELLRLGSFCIFSYTRPVLEARSLYLPGIDNERDNDILTFNYSTVEERDKMAEFLELGTLIINSKSNFYT